VADHPRYATIERRKGFWVGVFGEKRVGPCADIQSATEALMQILPANTKLGQLRRHMFEGGIWGFKVSVTRGMKAAASG
jgi:hypothetical protein